MTDTWYCNICGNEMWEQNGKYHCGFCERPDIFRRITIGKCWFKKGDDSCGNPVVEVPRGWWGSRHLPGRRTMTEMGISICGTCKAADNSYKEIYYKSVAHNFAWAIYTEALSFNQMAYDGWPEAFMERIAEIVGELEHQ